MDVDDLQHGMTFSNVYRDDCACYKADAHTLDVPTLVY